MKARSYTIVGSAEKLARIKDEYTMLGYYSFYRGADLVVSPWPKPKPAKTEDDAKKRLVSKRERNFGHARD